MGPRKPRNGARTIRALDALLIVRATNEAMYRRSAFAYAVVGGVGVVALAATALLVT